MHLPSHRLPHVEQPTTQSPRLTTIDFAFLHSNTFFPQFRHTPQPTHFLSSIVGPQSISLRGTPANQGMFLTLLKQ
jgi:hypothetical protein